MRQMIEADYATELQVTWLISTHGSSKVLKVELDARYSNRVEVLGRYSSRSS
jgi:hypothetical protein